VTGALLGGALVGLGALALVFVLAPPARRPAGALARLDHERVQERARRDAFAGDPAGAAGSHWLHELGRPFVGALSSSGIELGSLRSDLAVVGRPLDVHVAATVLAAVGAFLAELLVMAVLVLAGIGVGVNVPVLLAIVVPLVAAVVPTIMLRSQARARRRDFRHVVGSFLDLVAMSLAGGRGVPEALQSASEISDSWAMVRIRNALGAARLRGQTPWSALGGLGEELRIDELRDLASALALVAEDGARVRESLSARAGSMRRRELADSEGRAGESSQSMLVAQLLLCVGFLIFLVYPAIKTVIGDV